MTHPAGTDQLLLFSSVSGQRYGYNFDGWKSDTAFHYTGEGQVGDQLFTRGNAALRDHVSRGLRLRLFEEARRATVRYLGEFQLARIDSYYFEEAMDRLQERRKVIVFRLVPVDAIALPAEYMATQASKRLAVRDVPIEDYVAETFQVELRRKPTIAERREAALVQRYSTSLLAAGRDVTRKEIQLPELGRALYTDIFDVTTGELVEAKSSASRHHVRLAIGQLCDYGRYVNHAAQAVLLPSDPGADLIQLLNSLAITCIYEEKPGVFIRREPPPFVDRR